MLCFLCPVVSLLFLLGELVYNPASFAFVAFLVRTPGYSPPRFRCFLFVVKFPCTSGILGSHVL